MARLRQLLVENFKSIQGQMVLNFPTNMPVILIGENNAGKSNIVRAIDLMFGEFHPKYKDFDDHEYYDRNPENKVIIEAKVEGMVGRLGIKQEHSCIGFKFCTNKGKENDFVAIQDDGNVNKYVSNTLRGELPSLIVNAEQNLSYQLSYTSKFTLLSKVTKAFHEKLIDDKSRIEKLKALYENIKSIFLEVEEFSKFKNSMSSIAGEIISNMTYGLELDFSAYDPSNYFKTLRVNPAEGGTTRNFEELGAGQQQILALSFAHAYSKSFLAGDLILIIDEPESHLHPLAQKWLAKTMFQMAKDGLQLIITTHSPHFINLEYFKGINLIRKDADGTIAINYKEQDLYDYCIKTGSDDNKTKPETVIPFYTNHSTPHILNGLFANKIVLVEGASEELALPILFEKAGLDSLKEGIEILSVSGKGNIAKWWRFFTLFQIPTFVCFDNDGKHDEDRSRRSDALKAIGLPPEQVSDVLKIADWNINSGFCVFGQDYETTMRNSFAKYAEIESQLLVTLGKDSKHILARETAKNIIYNKEEIGWQKIFEFAEVIKTFDKPKVDDIEAKEETTVKFI